MIRGFFRRLFGCREAYRMARVYLPVMMSIALMVKFIFFGPA